jgi:hypothetical protein
LDNLAFDSLDEDKASSLELRFEEREVFEVVKSMHRGKALGPDGFSMAFFQDCWDVLKADIMVVFSNFHAHGKFENSLKATFIILISKKPGALDLKDFRPISLVSGFIRSLLKYSPIG